MHDLTALVFGVLECILIDLANTLLIEQQVPKYIPLIIKDIASFRLGLHKTQNDTKIDDTAKASLKVPFYNKGIEMIKLSQILHSKPIKRTVHIASFKTKHPLPSATHTPKL